MSYHEPEGKQVSTARHDVINIPVSTSATVLLFVGTRDTNLLIRTGTNNIRMKNRLSMTSCFGIALFGTSLHTP